MAADFQLRWYGTQRYDTSIISGYPPVTCPVVECSRRGACTVVSMSVRLLSQQAKKTKHTRYIVQFISSTVRDHHHQSPSDPHGRPHFPLSPKLSRWLRALPPSFTSIRQAQCRDFDLCSEVSASTPTGQSARLTAEGPFFNSLNPFLVLFFSLAFQHDADPVPVLPLSRALLVSPSQRSQASLADLPFSEDHHILGVPSIYYHYLLFILFFFLSCWGHPDSGEQYVPCILSNRSACRALEHSLA